MKRNLKLASIINYMNFINIGLIFLISINVSSASIVCESNGTTDYAYNLPQRNIINCPSYQKFTFSCHSYHVINIDKLSFSPYSPDPSGECTSDWANECSDDGYALSYLNSICSSRGACTVHSNELRKKSKCILNEVISISYKCIPTWEVLEVPIKCDICKNVTYTSGNTPNFGFLHSSLYTHHQSYVSCVSQIQNKPDHIVVVYTVNGFIGPDQILIETYNDYGIHINQILTGNITTNLIMTSNYNVNITILPETYQVFNSPQFLLYYYVVPKCEYMLCPESTTTTPNPYIPPIIPPTTTTKTSTTTTTTTTYVEQSTYAPPLIADKNKKNSSHATVSDAWLAAILGLVYAVLMIFAVLAAIYFRRRRKANNVTDTQVILSPSIVSTSRIMTPSMNQSHISLTENSMRANSHVFANSVHVNNDHLRSSEYNHIYSREQTYEEFDSHNQAQRIQKQGTLVHAGEYNEFDNFSQVITDEDNFTMLAGGEMHQRMSTGQRSQNEISSSIYPYSLRGHTTDMMSTIRSSENTLQATMTHASEASQGGYRAVEYSRSPDGERVRVTNTDEFAGDISSQALRIDRINASQLINQNNHISAYSHQESKKTITLNDESSKNFSVKLFPTDLGDETQEMTMFVDNSNEDLNTSRIFKIDLNK